MSVMKYLILLACAVGLSACSSSRVSRYDEFEKVKVDRMAGNAVSGRVFARTLVCLNAARESKGFVAVTNQTVTYVTNYVVSSTTNQTVTTSGNQQIASLTNALITPPLAAKETTTAESAAPAATVAPPSDTTSSGVTTATARNESVVTAPNQITRSGLIQTTTTLNAQATVNRDSLAITTGTNEITTVETNYVVTTVTNQVVTPVTNATVATSEHPVADYYLYTEVAPPDFPLVPGESLVVLVDGVRYACNNTTPQTAWESRRGFLTTYYKVAPEVIVGIANAKEVRLRIRGAAGTIERTMNRSSRHHFREFLLKNFAPTEQAARTEKSGDGGI